MVERTDEQLRVELLSAEAELAALAPAWDELVAAMPRPSPFLLSAWLVEWWRHFGAGGRLAVSTAFRGDRLVAGLPLFVRARFGLRTRIQPPRRHRPEVWHFDAFGPPLLSLERAYPPPPGIDEQDVESLDGEGA